MASEIALPFTVGAGTISLTMLMSRAMPVVEGVVALAIILCIHCIAVLSLKLIRDNIDTKPVKKAFDKNMMIMMRVNGFFLGAIGVNMIMVGVQNVFL